MKCLACGVEKDMNVKGPYPYDDDGDGIVREPQRRC